MVFAATNKERQLLYLSYIGHVGVEEMERGLEEWARLLEELQSGFRILGDLGWLERMDVQCAPLVGRMMEMAEKKGVSLVVRVIPDPRKDIGLNILSLLHYRTRPRTVTCKNMVEAGDVLGFGARGAAVDSGVEGVK